MGRALLDQVALWLAASVVAGALQLGVARALQLGFSVVRWGWESRDLAWRVPLGYLLVFTPVAVVLLGATVILGPRRSLRLAAWTWATLVVFATLLLFPQIHGYASLVLAGGLAWILAPWLLRRQRGFLRAARTIGVAGGGIVLLMPFLAPRLRQARERSVIAALPAAPTGAPNILLLILDTVRADYLSLYGASDDTTPKLLGWASRGVVFDEAYSTSSWTTPSHASFFTGQWPSAHGASFTTRLGEEHMTLAELLGQHGWATGGFTANYAATPIESGLAQGFLRYEDLKNSLGEIARSTTITQSDNVLRFGHALRAGSGIRLAVSRFLATDFTPRVTELAHEPKSAAEVRAQFGEWLDGLPDGRPFFAFLNFFDAHAPYRPPEPYVSMFGTERTTENRYKGSIRYLDDQLDALFRDLERRGILDNTLVVITSDHGEQFGEHGQDAHANSLYRQVLHVPLVVLWPGSVPAGIRVGRQVSGRDIPATILDLVHLSGAPAIGGTPLAPLWRDASARASEVVAEVDQNMRPVLRFRNSHGPMKAVFNDTLHVIRDGQGRYEAYRYRDDPAELQDLVVAPPGDSMPFADELRRAVSRNSLVWPRAVPPARPVSDPDPPGAP